ncbi:MAG: prepilin-type N-terminal cleavage/methylation domain-containing protein [Gemmatimonadota bacterium]|nr:prepilin-type N-terminal cleavage/methylation domain-containing protein [Gemmatimonadota bacterium]
MKQGNGFTLIELLIVVVIIAILAAIALPQLFGTKERSYVASMRSDLRNLMTAQEAYYADFHLYSGSLGGLGTLYMSSPNVSVAVDSASGTGWGATAVHSSSAIVCTVAVTSNFAGSPICS